MPVIIGRRELIAAFGGAAAAWPLAARTQQAAMPVGRVNNESPDLFAYLVRSFPFGLSEFGDVERRDVAKEHR